MKRLIINVQHRLLLLFIIYISIASVFSACENEIPYEPKKQNPQLILNALLNAGEKENFVYLNLSNTQNVKHIEDATLTLYINGKNAETAQTVPLPDSQNQDGSSLPESARQKKFRLTSLFKPGDVLRLEASAEEGQYHASAEVTVPQPVNSVQVDTCLAYIKEYDSWSWFRQFNIAIQDRPNETNYYRLNIQYAITEAGKNEMNNDTTIITHQDMDIINRADRVLTDGHPTTEDDEDNGIFITNITNKYNIFTDHRFANTTYTLKVYADNNIYISDFGQIQYTYYIKESAIIHIRSITEEEYQYLKALNCLESDDYDETIMEPVILPSNVKGGIGFVGVSSETKATIQLPDQYFYQ
ncbi:MAG: DUF4249 domain-containing protein [Bacteroides sp.]|jgi:hypothetical protein|nr:DUF4249 domain-containing protein [Bacteroides sp.]MCI1682591.1 DUF4249 domain-containing protein [Bacteroides sp.]